MRDAGEGPKEVLESECVTGYQMSSWLQGSRVCFLFPRHMGGRDW